MIRCLVLIALFVLAVSSARADFDCAVSNLPHDGDTFTCDDGRKVRLAYIDAPEWGPPYGHEPGGLEARQALAALIHGKTVRVVEIDRDRYGRIVGEVRVWATDGTGTLVNLELVRAGLAWAYRRYAPPTAYVVAEQEARDHGAGVWPQPPWLWREQHKP
jgi:endonuclease YncB( thermonuclease family)